MIRHRLGYVVALAMTAVLTFAACTGSGSGETGAPGDDGLSTTAPLSTDALMTPDAMSTDGTTTTE